MRHLVASSAAIVASILLFASLASPILAASRWEAPISRLALQGQPPQPQALADVSGSASAGAISRGNTEIRNAASNDKNIFAPDSNPEIRILRGQARAEAGTPLDEKTRPSAPETTFPSLAQFTSSVKSGNPGLVSGVYVSGVIALKVTPYPAGNPLSVTALPGYVTQSCGVESCPSIGLLAHNILAGALFSRLSMNQEVVLVYGDGHGQRFRISRIRRYQALNPTDPYSDFVDLENLGQKLTSTDVFAQTFGVGKQVVFQTCIAANGILTWGRLFVIADPI